MYSVHVKSLIERFTDNADLKKLVNDIREVEEKIRNDAAHNYGVLQGFYRWHTSVWQYNCLCEMPGVCDDTIRL